MAMLRELRLTSAVAGLLAVSAVAVPAQNGVSFWGGAGLARQDSPAEGRWSTQFGVQLGVPLIPVAARVDLLALGNDFNPKRISHSVNAVMRLDLPLVQPYAIAGRGTYKLAPDFRRTGWNYGAGVRAGLGRTGIFAELRRHHPVRRTIIMIGLTF